MNVSLKTEFIFRKSDQLSNTDRIQWLELFSRVFGKKKDQGQFDQKYLCTPFGYSYHGLMKADDRIVGAYNTIPYIYKYFNKEVFFALSVDTMVDSRHRAGPFNVKNMASLAYEAMKLDRICFVFGFPNEQIYNYTKRILKWSDIGTLDKYVLVRNIGAVIPKMRFLNPISRIWTKMLIDFKKTKYKKDSKYNIEKVWSIDFETHRYNNSHQVLDLGNGGKCFYHIDAQYPGARKLYITDVNPLNNYFFRNAIKHLYSTNAKDLDVLLYVGRLPFKSSGMMKVSNSSKISSIRMCGMILDPAIIDDRVFSITNWNINTSNYD